MKRGFNRGLGKKGGIAKGREQNGREGKQRMDGRTEGRTNKAIEEQRKTREVRGGCWGHWNVEEKEQRDAQAHSYLDSIRLRHRRSHLALVWDASCRQGGDFPPMPLASSYCMHAARLPMKTSTGSDAWYTSDV